MVSIPSKTPYFSHRLHFFRPQARCYTPLITSAGRIPNSAGTSTFCTASAPLAPSYQAQRARLQTKCSQCKMGLQITVQALHSCCTPKFIGETLRSLPARLCVLPHGSTPLHTQVAASRFCPLQTCNAAQGTRPPTPRAGCCSCCCCCCRCAPCSAASRCAPCSTLLRPRLLQPRRATGSTPPSTRRCILLAAWSCRA